MKKNFVIILLALLCGSANIALGETGGLDCIQLEGLNLGCVSSVDHSCKMNKATDMKVDCAYGDTWRARFRVEGPIQWNCKSYETTFTPEVIPAKGCPVGCDTYTPETTKLIPHSVCEKWEDPVCAESCVGCYENVLTSPVGTERGCTICTRQRCADEPLSQISCPPGPNGMNLLGAAKKCSTDERCPKTAVDNKQILHNVIIKGPTSCEPGPAPPPASPMAIGKYCPWKTDQRTGGSITSDGGTPASAGKCECITHDNWNNAAGEWPGCPPTPAGP